MEITSESKAPEFEPPQACVNRVIKAVLPENVQVTKDARVSFDDIIMAIFFSCLCAGRIYSCCWSFYILSHSLVSLKRGHLCECNFLIVPTIFARTISVRQYTLKISLMPSGIKAICI